MQYTVNELALLRQALDQITVNGKDVKYVAQLQIKLENHIETLAPTPPKK